MRLSKLLRVDAEMQDKLAFLSFKIKQALRTCYCVLQIFIEETHNTGSCKVDVR